MADTGLTYPTVALNRDHPNWWAAWTPIDNIKDDDGSNAIADPNGSPWGSAWAVGRAFGFNFTGGIDGIEVEIDTSEGTAPLPVTRIVGLTKQATGTGNLVIAGNTENITANGVTTYGGATSKWGTTWTWEEVTSSDFGVAVHMGWNQNNGQGYIDYVRVRVYYTPWVPIGQAVETDKAFHTDSPIKTAWRLPASSMRIV